MQKPPFGPHDLEALMTQTQDAVKELRSWEGSSGEQQLGDRLHVASERYELSWAGKAEARDSADVPPRGILQPCPELSVSFDTARHIFIEGENLETLKLLQAEYLEKVKMIYIDPPYNKGKDFVYNDDFKKSLKDYLVQTGQAKGRKKLNQGDLETAGRFHSDWLSMMYPRLVLARRFLRDDGVIFVSIDDSEVHNLRLIMNEIFGEDNFVNILHVKRAAKNVNQQFSSLKRLNLGIEYVLVYRKGQAFSWIDPYKEATDKRKQGYWTSFYNNADRPTMRYELLGATISQGQWKWKRERALKAADNYLEFAGQHSFNGEKEELPLLKQYWLDTGKKKEFIKLKNGRPCYWVNPSGKQLRTTDWTDLYINDNYAKGRYGFDTAKNVKAIMTFIRSVSANDDIVLDFFAGSGTTGEAAMALNNEDGGKRQCICVQIPVPVIQSGRKRKNPSEEAATIAEICRSRLADCANRYGTGLKVYRLSDC